MAAYVPPTLEIKSHVVHPNELRRTQAIGRIWSKFLQWLNLAPETRSEQSSVITKITDRISKPELEPNRTTLIRLCFGFGFRNPSPTEPNCSSSVVFWFWVPKPEPDRTEPILSPLYITPPKFNLLNMWFITKTSGNLFHYF